MYCHRATRSYDFADYKVTDRGSCLCACPKHTNADTQRRIKKPHSSQLPSSRIRILRHLRNAISEAQAALFSRPMRTVLQCCNDNQVPKSVSGEKIHSSITAYPSQMHFGPLTSSHLLLVLENLGEALTPPRGNPTRRWHCHGGAYVRSALMAQLLFHPKQKTNTKLKCSISLRDEV